MATIKIGALADSGDLYPFIPMMEGWVKEDGINLEFQVIPTVQDVNMSVLSKVVDVSVPSAAMYPYIQDDYFILGNAVATAIDGITGMPVLSTAEMKIEDLKKSTLIVHGPNTSAFTLYRLLVGKYGKLVIIPRVLDEIKALGKNGDVLVAVHEIKMMYAMRKLGIRPYVITSMWEMWSKISGGAPMPMGTVVVSKDLGRDLALKFKELYERSKKFAEKNLDKVIPRDVEIMSEAQGVNMDREIVEKTIWADIQEYNVPQEKVMEGLSKFYSLTHERGLLPLVKSIDVI
ncbi:1,4-dihydroxy-6-naphtoate synthase [Metallosphaera sp. J1]|uniref:menaquinone biosynthesis family protein n=1 Tax=Metallosphaera TaxID=41980 RepID=UPI001EDD874F|nr:MqnA/MqnD/SBP family protein [Metallosphaera javensis (ex Hofmann et al. 2022)]MCG3109239.1 1,4-dihydroxy-6-naphtoate synthase [Metallosphaera javensis (ex Hofmann et al. 2022)]BCS92943.1 MAG: 1,4-dihydroxy-6-naphtoate synthase [Metallosphaera javensis (ex Sakai et al. 2022)]